MIRKIFLVLLVIAISFGGVYVFFKNDLDKASRDVKVVTKDNYTSNVKAQIAYGDTIEITGTPNLLLQVSQEGDVLLEDGASDKNIQYYYVGLQEYGYDFVVRIAPGKLFAKEQSFKGEVTGLTKNEFGNRIKNSLNKPISFEDSVNLEAGKEIDIESQEQISSQSEANFTSSTLLVLDNQIQDKNEIYISMLFWSTLMSAFLITLFRKNILY